MTAAEAAEHVFNGATVGFSGFTPAGAAKAVPRAIAERAKALHAEGKSFQIRVLTGASTGKNLDEALGAAEAISWRAPYQSSKALRKQMNSGKMQFVDMHLSHVPQTVAEGFFGPMDIAVVEATDVTPDGRVYLSSSIGASPTYLRCAEKVIIEINRAHSPRVSEMADITILPNPPHRSPIPIFHALERIGWPFASVDPKKVIGIVETDEPDDVAPFAPADETSNRIASNVVAFLLDEMRAGRIPPQFLPLQSGVGNIANAVMAGLGESEDIPPFLMYSEVFQDALVDLMERGQLRGASATSLTLSPEKLRRVYDNMDFFGPRIVLRPQEISNNPGVVRRLGVITTNTALEIDIYGHANSTHVSGTQMMNGIGGSGDFTRNAYLSIFMCPSFAKDGRISTIVPMATHVDHNEHSVQVVITEQGIADLRGKGPIERARTLINHCAHPAYREYLTRYLEDSPQGHIRHDLRKCFEMHLNLMESGQMLPDIDLKQFV
ncbi:MAG: acetyl-CoA hydrolase/transferase family protein [Candidatus Sumerlaeia bacterium]|nr:acetyl-CoA hydrolase/transferase family protein [Candidatus Sumerlaeia bacterium]